MVCKRGRPIVNQGRTHLCQTRQIDQGQAKDVRGIDFEVYGLPVDTFIIARYPGRLILDFPLHFCKVGESSAGHVVKFCPFILACDACWSMWYMNFIIFGLIGAITGYVDELEDKRSSSDDAAASREEISTNNILKYGGFSG